MQGQADDLGGGVFKKRLNDNRHRSIIIAKGGKYWIYTYLFAKKDRGNIDIDELAEFKKLAALYSRQTGYQLKAGQFKVKPFVVSLSNHERLNRPPFDKLRANG
jgi:hypothetical protein